MTTIAVTDAIRSFTEVESRFGLVRSLDPDFFTKWQHNFEDLTQIEKSTLDLHQLLIKSGFAIASCQLYAGGSLQVLRSGKPK